MALKQLDVRGDICPYPMMKTVQALKKLTAQDEGLEVITDHAPALETIPTQAARLGYAAQIDETGSPEWRITLTRSV
ncbi:MAG: sulfurtransferase TusA family protein [Caldilineaceae bacterium]|nr:sulfurtransferase TusA family protein [Caldilineaceae bacterium]